MGTRPESFAAVFAAVDRCDEGPLVSSVCPHMLESSVMLGHNCLASMKAKSFRNWWPNERIGQEQGPAMDPWRADRYREQEGLAVLPEPRMLLDATDGDPLLDVYNQHPPDKVSCTTGDLHTSWEHVVCSEHPTSTIFIRAYHQAPSRLTEQLRWAMTSLLVPHIARRCA